MFTSRTGVLFALTLTVAGAAPALAQSNRYATDPDPFIYARLPFEHLALSHTDAVLPQTKLSNSYVAATARSPLYKTDPDPRIRAMLLRETVSY